MIIPAVYDYVAEPPIAITLLGSALNLGNIGIPAIAPLTTDTIAYIDNTFDSLRAYGFDGSTWAQVGNSTSISGLGTPSIVQLSDSLIVVHDSSLERLRAYSWDGSDFSPVGSTFLISGSGQSKMCALSSSLILFIDEGVNDVKSYSWNGSNFTEGNLDFVPDTLVVSNHGLAFLSANTIALLNDSNNTLRTYGLSGGALSVQGVGLTINFGGLANDMCAMRSTRVVCAFNSLAGTDGGVGVYDFIGNQWQLNGLVETITAIGAPSVCRLSSSTFALVDADTNLLRTYSIFG